MSDFKTDLELAQPTKGAPSALPATGTEQEQQQQPAAAQAPKQKKRVLVVDRHGKLHEVDADSIPPALPSRMPAPPISHDAKGRQLSQEEAHAQAIRREPSPVYRTAGGRVTNMTTGKTEDEGSGRQLGGFGVLCPGMTSRKL